MESGQKTLFVLTKYDQLSIIAQESPRAVELLAEYGLHCVNCFMNEYDTLEIGAQMHGMSDEEMQEMIDEINMELEKEYLEEKRKFEARNSKSETNSKFK